MREIKHTSQARAFLDTLKKKGNRSHGVSIIHRYQLLASIPKQQILDFPTVQQLHRHPLVIMFEIDYRELEDLEYWEGYEVVCLVEKNRFVVVSIGSKPGRT